MRVRAQHLAVTVTIMVMVVIAGALVLRSSDDRTPVSRDHKAIADHVRVHPLRADVDFPEALVPTADTLERWERRSAQIAGAVKRVTLIGSARCQLERAGAVDDLMSWKRNDGTDCPSLDTVHATFRDGQLIAVQFTAVAVGGLS